MLISIVIATANREQSIRTCLASMAKLHVPVDVRIECVVVDNNSKDNTADTIKRLLPSLPFDGKYYFHPTPGASSARNAGIRQSSGEIIAFTDDDCIVDQDWLVEIANRFSSDSELSLIGGRVELYSSDDLPFTIKTSAKEEYLQKLSHLHGFLHGCNLVVRRQLFEQAGLFDERLGAGSSLKSAEDTDLVYRAFQAGAKIAYLPSVLVYHNHGRSKMAEIRSLQRHYKIGRGAFYAKNLMKRNFDVLVILFVQLRPPVRRWIWGPQRLSFFFRYLQHLFNCLYLFVGASQFLRSGRYEPDEKRLNACS